MLEGINYYPLESVDSILNPPKAVETDSSGQEVKAPTFFDVFRNIVEDAAAAGAQKSEDMVNLMIGDTDDLDVITANITKAEIALELLVNVKNTAVDSFNEIIRMSV